MKATINSVRMAANKQIVIVGREIAATKIGWAHAHTGLTAEGDTLCSAHSSWTHASAYPVVCCASIPLHGMKRVERNDRIVRGTSHRQGAHTSG